MAIQRKEIFSIEQIHPLIKSSRKKHYCMINGDKIKITSLRLNVFKNSDFTCPICGVQAEYFAKEKNINDLSYHLNLYSGSNILFTKDHIVPKSSGGLDCMSNLQIMCKVCNEIKGSRNISNEELKREIKLT